MKKIRLYVNSSKPEAIKLSSVIMDKLTNAGYVITDNQPDIVIGFGGDGTLLEFLKSQNYVTSAKYIGIQCGTLGFLQDFKVEDTDDFVNNIPTYIEQQLNFISIEITCGSSSSTFYALNEFYISNSEDKTLRLKVCIEDELLENYVGSGLLFCSPTGSTARNLSASGSIMLPNIPAFQMTPSEATSNRELRCLGKSIIIPRELSVTLTPNNSDAIKISSDARKIFDGTVDKIKVMYSQTGITKLNSFQNSFIAKIREKII